MKQTVIDGRGAIYRFLETHSLSMGVASILYAILESHDLALRLREEWDAMATHRAPGTNRDIARAYANLRETLGELEGLRSALGYLSPDSEDVRKLMDLLREALPAVAIEFP